METVISEVKTPTEENVTLRLVMRGDEDEKAADYANYFCSYASLYHQKQMLTDHKRMQAYYGAIMNNKEIFEGKRVLDIGTGSGILALWCAKAGAAKVFAVEYTDMAMHAKKLIEANGESKTVEVIKSSVEELDIDGKVDIIISEWMGYFLLRESMLDSVVRARDKWLKADGLILPSHATMYWGLISDEEDRLAKSKEYIESTQEWFRFKKEMKKFYQCDMTVLERVYMEEQKEYYIFSSFRSELEPYQSVGKAAQIKTLDLNTCTLKDVQGLDETAFRISLQNDCHISGFAGWFSVDFTGSEHKKLANPVTLSTGPDDGYTHWGQQVFYLEDSCWVSGGKCVEGTIALVRQRENIRLYNLVLKHRCQQDSKGNADTTYHKVTYLIP